MSDELETEKYLYLIIIGHFWVILILAILK